MANEKRLIDANALAKNGWHLVKTGESNQFLASMSLADVPTVDAVEVVRCKDCKCWIHMEDEFGDCTNRRFHLDGNADPTMKADDFCSCGERKYNDT